MQYVLHFPTAFTKSTTSSQFMENNTHPLLVNEDYVTIEKD